ncbi:PTS transporter subunit IIC [Rhodococcus erythropolis]|uniref:PTS galactitol transporter subunit IIC n=1 Tax=Rhodococcus erythropolis TaxID=1833 RepID=UPI00294A7714|nr:PTS transporter subunit IIC [Rhodococcus erythropolis]MDV6277710.1 PTS transporter subunit IIC [Rhodococcus erythropolis]
MTELGPAVVLPILMAVFGLCIKLKPARAIKAGVLVGVGFIGVNVVIGLLFEQLGPAATGMAERFGVRLSTLDVGWPGSSAIAFGSQVGAVVIPMCLLLNLALLAAGMTRTLNIDLWNYWHYAFVGAIVGTVTGSFVMGLLAAGISMIVVLAIADLTVPYIQNYHAFPGISFPHGTSAPYALLALPLNKLFDRIPGLKKIKADPEAVQKRFGIFGDTMILGLVLGLLIGIAGYGVGSREHLIAILTLSMSMAAIMLLLPRMVAILMEGLIPISDAARDLVQRKFSGRRFYIGVDAAIAIGQPAVLATSLLLIPVTVLLAILLAPLGNTVLPVVDLTTIPFIVAIMVPIFRGNLVRSVLGGAIVIGTGLFLASAIAETFTAAASAAGFEDKSGASQISSLVDGANPLVGLFYGMAHFGVIGMVVLAVVALAFATFVQFHVRRRDAAEIAAPDVDTHAADTV